MNNLMDFSGIIGDGICPKNWILVTVYPILKHDVTLRHYAAVIMKSLFSRNCFNRRYSENNSFHYFSCDEVLSTGLSWLHVLQLFS